jgi:hypothetical protein
MKFQEQATPYHPGLRIHHRFWYEVSRVGSECSCRNISSELWMGLEGHLRPSAAAICHLAWCVRWMMRSHHLRNCRYVPAGTLWKTHRLLCNPGGDQYRIRMYLPLMHNITGWSEALVAICGVFNGISFHFCIFGSSFHGGAGRRAFGCVSTLHHSHGVGLWWGQL